MGTTGIPVVEAYETLASRGSEPRNGIGMTGIVSHILELQQVEHDDGAGEAALHEHPTGILGRLDGGTGGAHEGFRPIGAWNCSGLARPEARRQA